MTSDAGVSILADMTATPNNLTDEDFDPIGCECELDWNCGLHTGGPTGIERINDAFAFEQSEMDRQGGWF